jgi:hypothetical protein
MFQAPSISIKTDARVKIMAVVVLTLEMMCFQSTESVFLSEKTLLYFLYIFASYLNYSIARSKDQGGQPC